MPVSAALERDPAVVGPLGGLLLSAVRASSPMLVVRAVRWWRDWRVSACGLPLFVVHDLGLLYGAPREQIEMGPRSGAEAAIARVPKLADLAKAYRQVVDEIARSQAAMRAASMSLATTSSSSSSRGCSRAS